MHVEIPFTYEALLLPAGSKRPRMETIRDRMTVEVRELHASETLPVATFRTQMRIGKQSLGAVITVRCIDGVLVEPALVPADGCLVPLMASDYVARLAADASSIATGAWSRVQHMASAFALDGAGDAKVVRSYREQAIAAVEQMAARSAFVAGGLHVPGSEPVYAIDELRRVRAEKLSDVRGKLPPNRIWRADEEEMFLESLSRLPREKADEAFDQHAIAVHRRDLLTWDRDVEVLRMQAARLVRTVHRSLQEQPLETILAWVALRDAARGEDADAIVAAVEQLADHDAAAAESAMRAVRGYRYARTGAGVRP